MTTLTGGPRLRVPSIDGTRGAPRGLTGRAPPSSTVHQPLLPAFDADRRDCRSGRGLSRRPPLRQRPSPARPGAIGAGESPRPDEEFGASESMAAAFCALFAPGDGGVVMQPCAGSVLAAELSLG